MADGTIGEEADGTIEEEAGCTEPTLDHWTTNATAVRIAPAQPMVAKVRRFSLSFLQMVVNVAPRIALSCLPIFGSSGPLRNRVPVFDSCQLVVWMYKLWLVLLN